MNTCNHIKVESFKVEKYIKEIYFSSLSLNEKVSLKKRLESDPSINESTLKRLAKWSSCLSEEVFKLRLEHLGLSSQDIITILGDKSVISEEEVSFPSWVEILRKIMSDPSYFFIEEKNTGLLLIEDIITEPFVNYFLSQIYSYCSEFNIMLTSKVNKDLISQIKSPLLKLALPSINAYFNTKKLIQIKQLQSGQLESIKEEILLFFKEYPTLLKLLTLKIEYFCAHLHEYFYRLNKDFTKICSFFANKRIKKNPKFIKLTRLQLFISDSHNQGRSAIFFKVVNFSPLIYKPKNLKNEEEYKKFLSQVNSLVGDLILDGPICLNRKNYGWAKFINSTRSRSFKKSFYKSYGRLVSLHYFLSSSDLIPDNIILTRKGPIVIDLELVITAPFFRTSSEKSFFLNKEGLIDRPFPINKSLLAPPLKFYEGSISLSNDSIPFLTEENIAVCVDSFRKIYRKFNKNKEFLHREVNSNFKNLAIRFVFRNTDVYLKILNELNKPELMKKGLDRSLWLEKMFSTLPLFKGNRKFLTLISAEIVQLERGDVPYFYYLSDKRSLKISKNKEIKRFFLLSALERASNLVLGSSEDQEHSLTASFQRNLRIRSLMKRKDIPKKLLSYSEQITEQILRESISRVFTIFFSKTPAYQEYNIFNGYLGQIMGVAAYNSSYPQKSVSNFIKDRFFKSYSSVLKRFVLNPEVSKLHNSIGLDIFAIIKIAKFLDNSSMVEEVHAILKRASLFTYLEKSKVDMVGGLAGDVIGLLALYGTTHCRKILSYAILAGDRLLDQQITLDSRRKAWITIENKIFTGMSHGAAGIALALARLYSVTKDEKYLKAVNEAILFEDTLRDKNNWYSYKDPISQKLMNPKRFSWCHGAPGIGLARLDMLDLPIKNIKDDIEHAIKFIINNKFYPLDSLCCGLMGMVDFLFTSGLVLEQDNLKNLAIEKMEDLIIRILKGNKLNLIDAERNFGFFQGLSGICYQFLRLNNPERFPSILSFN